MECRHFSLLPWSHYYSRKEFFRHALRPASGYDSNWSFGYLAVIFAGVVHSQRHCSLRRWAAGPKMACSGTFDCSCRRMVTSVHALDLEPVPNSHKCLANCRRRDRAPTTGPITWSLHNPRWFDRATRSPAACYLNSAVAVVPARSSGSRLAFCARNYDWSMKNEEN